MTEIVLDSFLLQLHHSSSSFIFIGAAALTGVRALLNQVLLSRTWEKPNILRRSFKPVHESHTVESSWNHCTPSVFVHLFVFWCRQVSLKISWGVRLTGIGDQFGPSVQSIFDSVFGRSFRVCYFRAECACACVWLSDNLHQKTPLQKVTQRWRIRAKTNIIATKGPVCNI